jgi:dihydroflavonol-4-reductase
VSRVFLTGGSGFVGGALADHLIARGDDVVALARSDAAERALTARGAHVVRGDVLDEDAMAAGMAGTELVYHVAGINTMCPKDPAALIHVNVRGAEAAVRAAARAGVPRVVLTSSAASLGEAEGTVGREDSPHRGSYMSVYERSKHEGEVAAFAAARRAGVELVSVNPSSVQGPGRAGGTGKILIAYLNGKLRAFLDTRISIVDIADCVEGHVLAAERGLPGERYVLNGTTLRSREALDIVSELAGVRHDVRLLPPRVATVAGAAVEAVFRVRGKQPPVCREMVRTLLHGHRYDGSRAERDLGLRYTPVEDTFRRTIEWAVAQGLVRVHTRQTAHEDGGSDVERDDETRDPHPARPEQLDENYATGVDRKPDSPEEDLEPNYARGVDHHDAPGPRPEGRFSEGAEELPDSPEKRREGSFAEGTERIPDDDD